MLDQATRMDVTRGRLGRAFRAIHQPDRTGLLDGHEEGVDAFRTAVIVTRLDPDDMEEGCEALEILQRHRPQRGSDLLECVVGGLLERCAGERSEHTSAEVESDRLVVAQLQRREFASRRHPPSLAAEVTDFLADREADRAERFEVAAHRPLGDSELAGQLAEGQPGRSRRDACEECPLPPQADLVTKHDGVQADVR